MARLPSRTALEWRQIATSAVHRTIELRGAVVWPEVEGLLAHDISWLRAHMPGLDDVPYIDPHHLATARALLLNAGLVNRTIGEVGGRPITVFVDAQAMTRYGRKTAVTREAGRKRRLYGTLWGWTGTPKLCGQVAERQVAATLESLAGRVLWLDQARGAGEVRAIRGIKVPGGPLDNAGSIAVDPARPNAGFVDFVVEVKNVRQTLYPEHREIYDLLWKAGHFPDHVPILIAPRIHHNTFLLFKAVGALGYPSTRQSFAGPPAIERDRFRHVMKELAIPHTQQLLEPSRPSPPMARFFSKTVHTTSAASEGKIERLAWSSITTCSRSSTTAA